MKESGSVNLVAKLGSLNSVRFRPAGNDIHGLSLGAITGLYVLNLTSLSQKDTIQNNTQEEREILK